MIAQNGVNQEYWWFKHHNKTLEIVRKDYFKNGEVRWVTWSHMEFRDLANLLDCGKLLGKINEPSEFQQR